MFRSMTAYPRVHLAELADTRARRPAHARIGTQQRPRSHQQSKGGELLERQFAVIQQDDLWDWSNAKKK